MRASLKRFTSIVLLLGLIILQAHGLFHDHKDRAGIGETDDECQLCSTVLSLKGTGPVEAPKILPVSFPILAEIPALPKAIPHAVIELPCLRGPPPNLLS